MTSHSLGRRLRLVVVVSMFATALGLAPAVSAAAPQPVIMTSHMTFNPVGFNYGDFTVAGGGGLICASGSVLDTRLVFAGFRSNQKVQILVLKDFTCPDGIIHIKIQVHIDFVTGETFTWVVLGGTGAYEHLSGSGQGTTIPNADPNSGNTNIYTGFLLG